MSFHSIWQERKLIHPRANTRIYVSKYWLNKSYISAYGIWCCMYKFQIRLLGFIADSSDSEGIHLFSRYPDEKWKVEALCMSVQGFQGPPEIPWNITALCYRGAWRGHSISHPLRREARHICIVVTCKYVSKFLLNKSHRSEYGIYCSILWWWHLKTDIE